MSRTCSIEQLKAQQALLARKIEAAERKKQDLFRLSVTGKTGVLYMYNADKEHKQLSIKSSVDFKKNTEVVQAIADALYEHRHEIYDRLGKAIKAETKQV